MAKYNELMAKVSVTPEMRARVLAGVAEGRNSAAIGRAEESDYEKDTGYKKDAGNKKDTGRNSDKIRNIDSFRKVSRALRYVSIAAAACLVIAVGARFYQVNNIVRSSQETQGTLETQGTEGPPEDTTATADITDYSSREELAEAIGFTIPEITKLPFDVTETSYTNSFGIARVDYRGAGDETLTFSKAVDDGTDISGDYNEYKEVSKIEIGEVSVTIKGDGGKVNLATWSDGGYAYAADDMSGMDEQAMKDILSEIIMQE